jgi:hypothetical protein
MGLVLLVGDAHAQSIAILVSHRQRQTRVVGSVSRAVANDLERTVHAGIVAADVGRREAVSPTGGDVAGVVDGRGDSNDGWSLGILTLDQLMLAEVVYRFCGRQAE